MQCRKIEDTLPQHWSIEEHLIVLPAQLLGAFVLVLGHCADGVEEDGLLLTPGCAAIHILRLLVWHCARPYRPLGRPKCATKAACTALQLLNQSPFT